MENIEKTNHLLINTFEENWEKEAKKIGFICEIEQKEKLRFTLKTGDKKNPFKLIIQLRGLDQYLFFILETNSPFLQTKSIELKEDIKQKITSFIAKLANGILTKSFKDTLVLTSHGLEIGNLFVDLEKEVKEQGGHFIDDKNEIALIKEVEEQALDNKIQHFKRFIVEKEKATNHQKNVNILNAFEDELNITSQKKWVFGYKQIAIQDEKETITTAGTKYKINFGKEKKHIEIAYEKGKLFGREFKIQEKNSITKILQRKSEIEVKKEEERVLLSNEKEASEYAKKAIKNLEGKWKMKVLFESPSYYLTLWLKQAIIFNDQECKTIHKKLTSVLSLEEIEELAAQHLKEEKIMEFVRKKERFFMNILGYYFVFNTMKQGEGKFQFFKDKEEAKNVFIDEIKRKKMEELDQEIKEIKQELNDI